MSDAEFPGTKPRRTTWSKRYSPKSSLSTNHHYIVWISVACATRALDWQSVKQPRLQSTIAGDNVEMKRSPIRQKESLAPLPIIGFEIGPAGLAVVDTKVFFSLDRKGREPMIVRTFAERAPNSPISPARAAATAREQAPAPVDADQLGHRG